MARIISTVIAALFVVQTAWSLFTVSEIGQGLIVLLIAVSTLVGAWLNRKIAAVGFIVLALMLGLAMVGGTLLQSAFGGEKASMVIPIMELVAVVIGAVLIWQSSSRRKANELPNTQIPFEKL